MLSYLLIGGHAPYLFASSTFPFQNSQFAQASGLQPDGRRNFLLQRVCARGPSQQLQGALGTLASIGPPEYAGSWGKRVCLTCCDTLDSYRVSQTQLVRRFSNKL
jgi:hypothetical protein